MNSPPDTAVPIKKRRKRDVILGAFFCLFAIISHGANLDEYHDAIWPPESKLPSAFSAPLQPPPNNALD